MSVLARVWPLLVMLGTTGCGLDPRKIHGHELAVDDGGRIVSDGAIRFAVVGNLRPPLPSEKGSMRSVVDGDPTYDLMSDIQSQIGGVDQGFVVLMGDLVRTSTAGEWRVFSRRMSHFLRGERTQETGVARISSAPLVGDHEALGDERFKGWGAAFPDAGREIGFNRVGSWYGFDIVSGDSAWRMVVLDGGKGRLGSRWTEQLNWLAEAVVGNYSGLFVFIHDPIMDLGGVELGMDISEGPIELMEVIDDATGMLSLRGVFSSGSHTSHVILPDGPFGALYVNAGGGGAPAHALRRWGAADASGRAEDVHLEPLFDLALLSALDRKHEASPLPEIVLDKAKARGSYQGFTGSFDPAYLPTFGWWDVTVLGPSVHVAFRWRSADEQVDEIYRIILSAEDGWKPM